MVVIHIHIFIYLFAFKQYFDTYRIKRGCRFHIKRNSSVLVKLFFFFTNHSSFIHNKKFNTIKYIIYARNVFEMYCTYYFK